MTPIHKKNVVFSLRPKKVDIEKYFILCLSLDLFIFKHCEAKNPCCFLFTTWRYCVAVPICRISEYTIHCLEIKLRSGMFVFKRIWTNSRLRECFYLFTFYSLWGQLESDRDCFTNGQCRSKGCLDWIRILLSFNATNNLVSCSNFLFEQKKRSNQVNFTIIV